jgi:hypothetical protein
MLSMQMPLYRGQATVFSIVTCIGQEGIDPANEKEVGQRGCQFFW